MPGEIQLVLDLPVRPALGRADFFVSPANRLALAQVESWPGWPSGRLAVTGPEGAGKTHLAHVWAARAGARIIHSMHLPRMPRVGIFHFHFMVLSSEGLSCSSRQISSPSSVSSR